MRLLLFFLIFHFNCFGFPEEAQDTLKTTEQELRSDTLTAPTPLEFDREEIKSLKGQPEFDYTEIEEQENWWTKVKRYLRLQWQRLMDWLFGDFQGNSILLFILELLPYLIIAGILFFVIWLFIKLNPGSSYLRKPQTGKVSLNEEERIVQSRDIKKLIDEAVSKGDYRLGVRYYYLLILQQLTEAGHIDYQYSKTDEEYLEEIKQESLRKQFGQITRIYDFIWYGNFEVTQESFRRAEREFLEMQEIIKTKR